MIEKKPPKFSRRADAKFYAESYCFPFHSKISECYSTLTFMRHEKFVNPHNLPFKDNKRL